MDEKGYRRIDSLLEEGIRFKVREDCAYCISSGTKRIKTMKKLIKENPDLYSFVAAVQSSGFLGATVERKENTIYATFTKKSKLREITFFLACSFLYLFYFYSILPSSTFIPDSSFCTSEK